MKREIVASATAFLFILLAMGPVTVLADIIPFTPTDDMEVAWQANDPTIANTNKPYGTNILHARSDAQYGGGLTRRSYLKFDLTKIIDPICGAKLKLWCSAGPGDGGPPILNVQVCKTTDGWAETTITWNNAPAVGAVVDTTAVDGSGAWYEWDIKSYVLNELAGDKVVSIVVKLENDYPPWDEEEIHHRDFHAKEHANKPVLEITIVDQCVPEFGADIGVVSSIAALVVLTLRRTRSRISKRTER